MNQAIKMDSEAVEPISSSTSTLRNKDFGFLPIPRRVQYDLANPPEFTLTLNLVFGFGATFTVASLYYCQTLLVALANEFNVSDSEVTAIPTLLQAGYAVGLLLITPLGDLVRRRELLLLLMMFSSLFTMSVSYIYSINHVDLDKINPANIFSFLDQFTTLR